MQRLFAENPESARDRLAQRFLAAQTDGYARAEVQYI
jgi:hypothetical protein